LSGESEVERHPECAGHAVWPGVILCSVKKTTAADVGTTLNYDIRRRKFSLSDRDRGTQCKPRSALSEDGLPNDLKRSQAGW
jgi:hypothetical protein